VREYSKAVKLASLLADGEEGLYLVIIYTYQHTGIDTSFGHWPARKLILVSWGRLSPTGSRLLSGT